MAVKRLSELTLLDYASALLIGAIIGVILGLLENWVAGLAR